LKESTSLLRKHEQSDSKRLGGLQFRWMKTDFVMEGFDTFLRNRSFEDLAQNRSYFCEMKAFENLLCG
jgi:hypothetical protein